MGPPGLSRPMRSAGFALLAVAVVAAVIGGMVLVTSGDESRMAEQPPGTSSSATHPPGETSGSTAGAPSGQSQPSSGKPNSSGDGDTGGSDSDGSASDGSGSNDAGTAGHSGNAGNAGKGDSAATGGAHTNGGTSGEHGSVKVPVRVYNNSTIADLASRAADDLRDQGWDVAEVANYSDGIIPATTVYYRKGTSEKAAALAMASQFGMRAKPRFDGIKDASSGMIVIVTKNYDGPIGKAG